jgi:nicotinamide-nucleotide amidase
MKHLMLESVEPFLAERLGADRVIIKAHTLRTVGMGESAIDDRIADLMQRSNPTVGLAAHMGQVDVRVTARAASAEAADSLIEQTAQDIRRRLGDAVFAEGDDNLEPLEAVVLRALQAAGYTLALVETNTGGDVAHRLQDIQGTSQVLRANYALASLAVLGEGAPDEIASQAAADWTIQRLWEQPDLRQGATLAVAVCGTTDPAAGPYGAYRGKTYMSLRTGGELSRHQVGVGGTDELARRWAGNGVLNWLRLWLARQGS